MAVDFESVLERFTAAVEAGNGQALASLFRPNGIYDDCFYGAKVGRDAIAKMLEQEFWGHAEGFKWEMMEPVCDGSFGYARYLFSYVSKLAGIEGRTVVFDGFSQFRFDPVRKDGLIVCYREQFNTGMAMAQLEFAPDRIATHLRRRALELRIESGFESGYSGNR